MAREPEPGRHVEQAGGGVQLASLACQGPPAGPLDGHWSVGVQWLAMARRDGLRADVPSFVTADALLRRTLVPGQSLALIVRNLADSQTYDPASSVNDLLRVPRQGRSLTLEWRAQF